MTSLNQRAFHSNYSCPMKKSLLLFITCLWISQAFTQAIKVEVQKSETGFTLLRGGEPYYIRGAGGHHHLDELVFLGGNSIRTWSHENAQEILDNAHKKGLTVMFGLWVQHERHGFDYNNEAAVQKQLDFFREIVIKYKDHPALLLWGIGNEVNLFYSNTKVWHAIQEIAKMIHELDGNHPTSTVTAGLDSSLIYEVMTKCPDIDIFGVNTYGDIAKVPRDFKKYGWPGPYIISEWGPDGHWEVAKTQWGAPLEQTSTEKAESYRNRYANYISANRHVCVGSYVFLWGQKQETTSTWYGLFTTSGNPTEPLDELFKKWQGKGLPDPSPSIQSVTLNGKKGRENIYLEAGSRNEATLVYEIKNPRGKRVTWRVYPESTAQSAGGDYEAALAPVTGVLTTRRNNSVRLYAPPEEGAYRLFVFIENRSGRTAYANIPFYVTPRDPDAPPARAVQLKTQKLEVNR
jgi:hypothetical protein